MTCQGELAAAAAAYQQAIALTPDEGVRRYLEGRLETCTTG
ncbi:hypothetical protein BH10ACT9_BH10ACT9_25060 [soil metagenome]